MPARGPRDNQVVNDWSWNARSQAAVLYTWCILYTKSLVNLLVQDADSVHDKYNKSFPRIIKFTGVYKRHHIWVHHVYNTAAWLLAFQLQSFTIWSSFGPLAGINWNNRITTSNIQMWYGEGVYIRILDKPWTLHPTPMSSQHLIHMQSIAIGSTHLNVDISRYILPLLRYAQYVHSRHTNDYENRIYLCTVVQQSTE